ncbi:MAG: c-type cytochrome domain-containing protein [Planctomycetaceae bacterium]
MKSVVVLLFLLTTRSVVSADEGEVDYARDVKSIFRERCYACHGALKQEGGLRLDTGSLAKTGGDNGAVIVPGDVAHSPLIERISAPDESVRMPPEGKPLTTDQISMLTRWVQSGAVSPDDEQPEQDPRNHWAFQKPVRPEVPVDRNSTATESSEVNPIDAFINAQLRLNGIAAMPSTDKATLLRRVCST